jgi:hypothetical protein
VVGPLLLQLLPVELHPPVPLVTGVAVYSTQSAVQADSEPLKRYRNPRRPLPPLLQHRMEATEEMIWRPLFEMPSIVVKAPLVDLVRVLYDA